MLTFKQYRVRINEEGEGAPMPPPPATEVPVPPKPPETPPEAPKPPVVKPLQRFKSEITVQQKQTLANEIDKVVNDFINKLKQELIHGSFQQAPRGIWDRFKGSVANIWYGRRNPENPYYWQNKLGDYLGRQNESVLPKMGLHEYKVLKSTCDSIESAITEAMDEPNVSNLKITQVINNSAEHLKTALKGLLKRFLDEELPDAQPPAADAGKPVDPEGPKPGGPEAPAAPGAPEAEVKDKIDGTETAPPPVTSPMPPEGDKPKPKAKDAFSFENAPETSGKSWDTLTPKEQDAWNLFGSGSKKEHQKLDANGFPPILRLGDPRIAKLTATQRKALTAKNRIEKESSKIENETQLQNRVLQYLALKDKTPKSRQVQAVKPSGKVEPVATGEAVDFNTTLTSMYKDADASVQLVAKPILDAVKNGLKNISTEEQKAESIKSLEDYLSDISNDDFHAYDEIKSAFQNLAEGKPLTGFTVSESEALENMYKLLNDDKKAFEVYKEKFTDLVKKLIESVKKSNLESFANFDPDKVEFKREGSPSKKTVEQLPTAQPEQLPAPPSDTGSNAEDEAKTKAEAEAKAKAEAEAKAKAEAEAKAKAKSELEAQSTDQPKIDAGAKPPEEKEKAKVSFEPRFINHMKVLSGVIDELHTVNGEKFKDKYQDKMKNADYAGALDVLEQYYKFLLDKKLEDQFMSDIMKEKLKKENEKNIKEFKKRINDLDFVSSEIVDAMPREEDPDAED